MKELNISILFGIEIFFKYHSLFMQILDNKIVDKINCSLNKETVLKYRGEYGEEFYESYYDLMRFILSDDRININKDQTYEQLDVFQLSRKYDINIEYKVREDLIKDFDMELPEKYITIATKSMASISKSSWRDMKPHIIGILNMYKYPVILLGERHIKQCTEYDIHGAYSIYEDLISGLNNYIDLTIEDSTHNNEMEPLQKTFFILNKSKLNLYISDSGVKTITICCSENVLGLGLTVYERNSLKHQNIDNIYQTRDMQEYLDRLFIFIKNNND
jgi:hypothetical protein